MTARSFENGDQWAVSREPSQSLLTYDSRPTFSFSGGVRQPMAFPGVPGRAAATAGANL